VDWPVEFNPVNDDLAVSIALSIRMLDYFISVGL